MNRKARKKLKEKLIKIANERFLQESLMRILLECIENDSNLKPYDIYGLAMVIYERIRNLKNETISTHKIMKI